MPKVNRRQLIRTGVFCLAVVALAVPLSWLYRGRPAPPVTSFAQCAQAGYVVSDTNPPACSDGHHAFIGPAASAASDQHGQSLPFELMVEGDSGGGYPQKQEVITSEAAWESYWAQVHSGLHSIPPILPVDFRTSDIVALSSGHELTNGYGLKVTSVNSGATGTIVDTSLTVPTVTCKVTNTTTNRYFIAKTPKLAEPVSFRLTTEYHHCP